MTKSGSSLKKIALLLGVSVLVTGVITLACLFTAKAQSAGTVVAKIADMPVTASLYNVYAKTQEDKLLYEHSVNEEDREDFLQTDLPEGSPKGLIQTRTLDKLKEMKIQLDLAQAAGITTESQMQQAKTYTDELLSGLSSEKKFLEKYGCTPQEYIEIYAQMLAIRAYIAKEEAACPKFSEEQLRETYDNNRVQLDTFTVRQLFLQDAGDTEKNAKIEEKSNFFLKQVKSGTPLIGLAKQYSEEYNIAQTEGLYEFKGSQTAPGTLEEWAVSAAVSNCAVVRTDYGYHVAQLEKRTEFEDVRDDIHLFMFEQTYMETLVQRKSDPAYECKILRKIG